MQEEINKCIEVLSSGGLILYPTDTVWGIGCDATNENAVAKIYALKQRANTKTMICLVANDFMLEKHVQQVPEVAYDIIDLATKPTTIVYDQPVGIAKNLIAEDNTLAIRVASDKFCQYLISKFKKPIVSTSANIAGEPTPQTFKEITQPILKGVDYVVNLHRDQNSGTPSSIIKLGNDGVVKIIRE
ncbi:L-threonylcarbamoyladenylate synthase [Cellulophaga tyrosinoxydans]|uniref:L-threonylcarbamoyladenylate synthase n=1 Tax=Cellulophaga tyrosinoxydans TaxID=504486 RepID=A0A1W2CS53_9FLAO|nr:L-threonylcarbamoyladenylate synthase [Cellulophaga tyrosinoxydans]SMC88031.1 L-threonylcarbamoyladenylate synthase [Cellulophaga tyrosinoxydans]